MAISVGLSLSITDDPVWKDQLSLTNMLNGTAHKPFIYRSALPATASGASGILGIDAKLIARGLAALCWFGAFLSFDALCHHMHQFSKRSRPIIWAIALVPVFLITGSIVYDGLTVLSFSLAFLAIARKHWVLYGIAFALATVNRETAFLLIGLYALTQKDNPHWLMWALVQAIFFLTIRGLIYYEFRHHPGVPAETHFLNYYAAMKNFTSFFVLVYGGLACLAWRIIRQATKYPQWLRYGHLAITAPLAALVLLVGFPYEFRAMLEAFPLVVLSAFGRFE